ncbi:hypothetical protein PoMZ_02885 [Pyricularia oryzae]|uniref:Uncharacterized protein n=1 Tax=Pyricularia oryzae TaxID=318829 RepID=A0A4P7N5V3_PYROR|nr:hypothetical protein PoMZ_02885 [Pyricularia oryzae]
MNETYGCDDNREKTSGRLSEHLQCITTSLAPYPRLLSGVLGALGTSSDKKNDAQNQELHQGSLAKLLQHYQNSSSSKTNSAYRASHVVFAHGLGRKMGSKIPANWNDI